MGQVTDRGLGHEAYVELREFQITGLVRVHKSTLDGIDGRLGTVAGSKLGQQTADVNAHSFFGNLQIGRNFAVAVSLCNQD